MTRKQPSKPAIPIPWVPSWAHHGPQGLADFVARQNERLRRTKQKRVKA